MPQHRIAEHPNGNLKVDALAERMYMSPGTSLAPMRKSAVARRQRRWTQHDAIAEDCGFNNEEQMRCTFIRQRPKGRSRLNAVT
jgi:AraC-like DNA-binding protein